MKTHCSHGHDLSVHGYSIGGSTGCRLCASRLGKKAINRAKFGITPKLGRKRKYGSRAIHRAA